MISFMTFKIGLAYAGIGKITVTAGKTLKTTWSAKRLRVHVVWESNVVDFFFTLIQWRLIIMLKMELNIFKLKKFQPKVIIGLLSGLFVFSDFSASESLGNHDKFETTGCKNINLITTSTGWTRWRDLITTTLEYDSRLNRKPLNCGNEKIFDTSKKLCRKP